MVLARRSWLLVGLVAMVWLFGRTAGGHTGESEHGHASHPAHQEEHHEAHHEHHDGHHEEHHGEHHGEHHDGHHGEHHDSHHDDHHDARHPDWYRHHWWTTDLGHHSWWHHDSVWHHHSWSHWWQCPTAAGVTNWFGGWGWPSPVYYSYGLGGNVVNQDNTVLVNGQATDARERARTAIALASVTSPAQASSGDENAWLPLGTFAVLEREGQEKPSQTLQLAVDRSGVLSGVLFDLAKGSEQDIHGSVARMTQRAAFGLGEKSGLIAETGIYNLTQDKITLLVHNGLKKPEQRWLIRLDAPPADLRRALSRAGK
jgi:hypothetical protein